MVNKLCVWAVFALALAMTVSVVSAIPASDLEQFRASARYYTVFDEYTNETQYFTIKAFHNDSDYYYIIFRANAGDAPPYDDFYLSFKCLGDTLATELHTTDYPSWEEAGFISFKRGYEYDSMEYYDGTNISMSWSYCWIIESSGLVLDGNLGYTNYYVELVPILDTYVITLNTFCGDEQRAVLIWELGYGIANVVEVNMNIANTLFIVFQIMAVIFIVLGIPIIIFMLIRWAIWRVSGRKLFDRNAYVS